MPKTIDFRTYLTLETALIRRLVKDWRQRTDPVYDAITKACRAREWDKARVLVRDLDLYETAAENREWIKYMLLAFAIFGAGQVSKDKPSFVGVGTYDKTLNQVVANMIVYLEHTATKQVQEEVLQLIAEDEEAHKVEKSNPYHDETGAFTSKELATNVIPGEFKGKWTLSSEQQAGMAADPKAQIRIIRVYEADSKEGEEPSETRVREYRSAMDRGVSFPLPEVYQIGEHSYKILDGNHRFAAWQKSNKLIPVIVHPRDEGEYVTGHVDVLAKKADQTGRFLTEFVSFGKEGDERLQLIASLNASRLATWGFTAECELRGVQEYQLTAVMDGRTSEFCRFIHGKRFRVEAARKKIIEALNVQNPDDLKTVQPWPKQTKANLEELRELSAEELTARGFHVPPFHPGCRTVCRLVDEEVQLEKAPVENPTMTQQWITLETLKELGIKATPEQIAHWNAYVALSPVELLQKLSGKSPQEILSGVLGKNAIQFQSNGDIAMQVRGVMADAKYAVGTVIDPYTATYYLTEAELLAGSVEAEREFLRRLFNSLIEIGQNSSVETLVVAVAGNGAGYVKMGFLPDAAQWNTIRAEALDAMENGELKEMFASLSNEQKVLVQHLLQDMDEHALGALVDLPVEFQGKTIGDWVLESVYGNFELKLTDKLAVEQAKEFLK